jgi:peptidoglycan L-alanyl-D-glutamate endopeptidase CwlK
MGYNLSKRSKARLEGVHPFIVKVIELGIKTSPEDFGIPMYGGLRTSADQRKLYDKGRTDESLAKGEKVVTYVDGIKKESNHQIKESGYGEAFDIYIYCHFHSRASWSIERLTLAANHLQKVALEVSKQKPEWNDLYLEWGGDWTRFKDYPHFQLARRK